MGEPVVFLPGKTIDLVVKNIDHIKIYQRWVNDPAVRTYIGMDLPEALETMKKEWFPDERDEKSVWFEIWHKKDKQPIGLVGLFKVSRTHRSAELGIFIGEPEYWGIGIGHQKEMEFINGEWQDVKLFGIFKENRKTD